MDRPAASDTSPLEALSEIDEARRGGGRLHLTTSLLVSHENLRAVLRERGSSEKWEDVVGRLKRQRDSSRLSLAIEPLFDDIADRKRGLFGEDFLIDTTSMDPAEADDPNVGDIIDIVVGESVSWATEGSSFRADLGEAVRFEQVRCRAFWVAHSNSSLSYHLSLEIPYQHEAAHYYALSYLQKVIFPTEHTTPATVRVVASRSLLDYLQNRFAADAEELFATVLERDPSAGRPCADELLRPLLGRPEGESMPLLENRSRKCMSVLEDPYFFHLLHSDVRSRLTELKPVEPSRIEKRVQVYDLETVADCPPEDLAYYFLSGLFQNVIDFLRQDLSEVEDGTDPIYPPPAVRDDSGHFIVYATPVWLYEVVSQSRSLNAGRGWIGTCPYLFLVHLMSLHNEDLVRRYEDEVRALVRHLDKAQLLGRGEGTGLWQRNWRGDATFERFHRFRLAAFNEVHRHRYFNVLRYDTERAFYTSIEEVRGIQQREHYWAQVVSDLERTVDDLRDAQRRRVDDGRNKMLAAVTVVGVLQVVFQILDYFFDGDAGKIEWALGLATVTIAVAVVAVWVWPWGSRD